MHILKDTNTVIWRDDTQILLVLLIPDLRQIFNTEAFIEQLLLDLVSDNDVKIIGQLIGFGTNQ
ncbi:hypothetical protein D3C71_1814400 [compost metagenome]